MLKKNPLRKPLDAIDRVIFVIQAICLYASVGSVVFTVLMREIFKIGILWGYEIACWFVILLLFLGMAHNLHYKTNLGVTFVYDKMPPKVHAVFSVIHFLVECTVLVMLSSGFFVWVSKVGKSKMQASGMTSLMYYGVIGIGIFLSAIEMIAEIIDLFVKKEPAAEVEEVHEATIEEELAQETAEKKEDEK